jgi:hypothetical protein
LAPLSPLALLYCRITVTWIRTVIYPRIYNAWRRKSGFGLLPPFDVYKEAAQEEFQVTHHLLHNTEEAKRGLYYEYSLVSLLVLDAFVDNITTSSFSLSGMRIATLSNGRIAIAPGSSLPGDFVCKVHSSPYNWILRGKDDIPSHSALDRQIVHQFKRYEYGPSYHRLTKEGWKAPVPADILTHAVFIGESFVDKTIGGGSEWGTPRNIIIH